MSAPKFTPGPWKFTPWHVEEDNSTVRAPDGWIICQTSSDDNARLISAAPELYGALKQIVIECTESPNSDSVRLDVILSYARAALAKAVQL